MKPTAKRIVDVWNLFDMQKTKPDAIIRCPDCGVTSEVSTWREAELPCDDCGGHTGFACPACDEAFWTGDIEVVG